MSVSILQEPSGELLGKELTEAVRSVFSDIPNLPHDTPMMDHVIMYMDYYVSRLMTTFGTDFQLAVLKSLECAVSQFDGDRMDWLKFLVYNYPTPREQFGLLMLSSKELRDYLPPPYECQQYCMCHRHYDWSHPNSPNLTLPNSPTLTLHGSGSATPNFSAEQSEGSDATPTPPPAPVPQQQHTVTSTTAVQLSEPSDEVNDERELEEFLARANLPHLFGVLRDNKLWVDTLRSIALGDMHKDLLPIVPPKQMRQRLIDALNTTVELRASHKEKQGMWLRAREEGRTVYIRGIEGLTDFELREYLETNHGPVTDMRYMFDPRNNVFQGFGFVMFATREAVDSILRRHSYTIRSGVTIVVKCSDDIVR